MFKVYQAKNKRIVEPHEIENRSKNIDLLRKNLNLLQMEKKSQQTRDKNKKKKNQSQSGRSSYGASTRNSKKDIENALEDQMLDIFAKPALLPKNEGVGALNESYEPAESEEDLNADEMSILKQFEENDKDLEDLAE